MSDFECPACGKKLSQKTVNTPYNGNIFAWQCPKCQCVIAEDITLGSSFSLVDNTMTEDEEAFARAIPYDLTCLSSRGISDGTGSSTRSPAKSRRSAKQTSAAGQPAGGAHHNKRRPT